MLKLPILNTQKFCFMDYQKYLSRPASHIPKIHQDIYDSKIPMDQNLVLDSKEIDRLLTEDFEQENGFYQDKDGSTYVSVLTKMPHVTPDMFDWWFWWHAIDANRYKIWYPDAHFNVRSEWNGAYNDSNLSYRERLNKSTHFVTEDIGLGSEVIAIDFMSPQDFGFDLKKMNASNTKTVICAKAGSYDKGIWLTEMCHAIRKVDKGVELRSRFWMGYTLDKMKGMSRSLVNKIINKDFIKRRLIPKELGRQLFFHCSQEFSILKDILPEIYESEA